MKPTRALTESEAIEAARAASLFGSCHVAWWRYSENRYLATPHEDYIEAATCADELVAGFEYGDRTF